MWEGKPSKQAELLERAGSPDTWPLVPRNQTFSGLHLHKEPVCIYIPLCPRTGPPDLAVTIPVEVLSVTLTTCRPEVPSSGRGLPSAPGRQ